MSEIVKKISLDVAIPNRIQAVTAKQYDINSRYLRVQLTNERTPISIDPTSLVTINATRADGGNKSYYGIVNDDGTATVPINAWMLELDDVVVCDITVEDTEGRILSSTSFTIEVERSNRTENVSTDTPSEEAGYVKAVNGKTGSIITITAQDIGALSETEADNKITEKTQTKADKIPSATPGNIAVIDENGNYIDSGESINGLKDCIPQIDTELDEDSDNPVSNKALTAAFNAFSDKYIAGRTHYTETLINKTNIISNIPLATISSGELYPAENLLEIGKTYTVSINGVSVSLESFMYDGQFVAIGDQESEDESYGFVFGTLEEDDEKLCGLNVTDFALCLQTFNITPDEVATAVASVFFKEETTVVHKLSNDFLNIDDEFDSESNNPISNKAVCELLDELALWAEEIENMVSSLPTPKTYTPGNGIVISEDGVISLSLGNAEEVVV